MYKVIGSDGKEYGPVGVDQIREWLAQGRLNANSRVLAEGTTEWKALSDFPELRNLGGGSAAGGVSPESQVRGPAIGLIVTAALGCLVQVLSIFGNLFGLVQGVQAQNAEAYANFFGG